MLTLCSLGMFTYDTDSNMFWFNPASFESADQYYLVGVVRSLFPCAAPHGC